jgi:hypothetical protein
MTNDPSPPSPYVYLPYNLLALWDGVVVNGGYSEARQWLDIFLHSRSYKTIAIARVQFLKVRISLASHCPVNVQDFLLSGFRSYE